MNKKRGLTLTSMAIYVALFFVFTVFVIAMSTNMNYKAMDEKAKIYIYEQFDKLQYNILSSAKASTSVDEIYGRIIFNNNDEYSYDSDKKIILKNGGILFKNVEKFEVITEDKLTNVNENFSQNIDSKIQSVCIEVTFKKYKKDITKQIYVTLGDDKI